MAALIGFVGELLLTAGLLLGLFVVWQVWWTDVAVSDDQAAAVEQIERSFETPSVEAAVEPRTDAPPAVAPVGEGEGFATLYVPRWGADYRVPITQGVGMDVLNTGAAGHYPDTALPGDVGNFALAAHRQSYGAAFHNVDQLVEGDPVIVETAEAWLIYEVREDYIVLPQQVDVIAPVPGDAASEPTQRLLTFTTCHPLWSTRERWITHAELTGWIPRSEGKPAELEAS
ncbi:class E sortase [Georgenia muralis]